MNELIKVTYDGEEPTVSARELHVGLEIKTNFTTWFDRMCEYGFNESDYVKCFPNLESGCNGGQNMIDYQISVDMAKQLCMIQRSEKGKLYRQYFIDLEKAWNTPDLVMARALKMADRKLHILEAENEKNKEIIAQQTKKIEADRPKTIFADAVSGSDDSILIGDLAKLIAQNGVDIGQKRMFKWLRENGYLVKSGFSCNMPTQKYIAKGYFEVKERTIQSPSGSTIVTRTTFVTGKGQIYFVNKFLNIGKLEMVS